jgi:hypothetical protein
VECVVRISGKIPANEFLDHDLEQLRIKGKSEPESTARAKFQFYFQQMANYGNLSPKHYDKEMGNLFAFKHEIRNKQIRFPCFRDGSKWLLTHGFFKPGAKRRRGRWPQNEIDRANEIMGEYWYRKQQAR